MYRASPIGIEAKAGIGAGPDVIVNYIKEVKSAIQGTSLSSAPVGHVDTWTAWVNGSNSAVVDACDWMGVDAYPYFQNTMRNGIDVGASLFEQAYQNTLGASNGKPVWITETGWPVSGEDSNLAVANIPNAQMYWDQVGCQLLFDKINTFWFTLQDADPITPNPSFGIVGSTLSTNALFDLSCSGNSSSSSSASSSSTATSSSGAASSASSSATSSLLAASATGGLTPAQGAGNGAGSPSASSSGSSSSAAGGSTVPTPAPASGGASGSSTGNSTTSSVTSASGSAAASTFTGAAAATTGHIIGGALAAIAVIAAAL